MKQANTVCNLELTRRAVLTFNFSKVVSAILPELKKELEIVPEEIEQEKQVDNINFLSHCWSTEGEDSSEQLEIICSTHRQTV